MSIVFNGVPSTAKLNNTYIELTKEKQSVGIQKVKQVIGLIGQGLPSASFSAGDKRKVFSANEVGSLYGFGSEIHNASKVLFQNSGSLDVYAMPLKEDAGDTESAGNIVFSGTVSKAGFLTVYIAGQAVTITTAVGDTAEGVVDKIVAAAPTDCVATLAKNGVTPEQLDITCKWKGISGDDITISVDGVTESGLTDAVITAMTGGAGLPDVQDALDAVAENDIMTALIHPYVDATNLTKIEAWESVRFDPAVKKGFYSGTAKRGNYATVVTGLTATRNSWTSSIVANQSPELSVSFAAGVYSAVANSATSDPSKQFNGIIVKGITTPKPADRWTASVRESAIENGCAVTTVRNDNVIIDYMVNTYQTTENSAPAEDGDRELVSVTLMTAVIYDRDIAFKSLWTGAKLANDGIVIPAGQKVMTPEVMKAFLLNRYQLYVQQGWVEEVALDGTTYADTIIVERDSSNANRINSQDQIFRIGNLRVTAIKIGWDFAV